MHKIFLDLLECPGCHSSLAWDGLAEQGERIEEAEAHCTGCGASYPVREGIGLFLLPDLPRNDLWEQTESQLAGCLREHAEVERQLMESPAESVAPADQFLRAMILTDRGAYSEAKTLREQAISQLYTSEYLACLDSQMKHLAASLSPSSWPLVDLASGEGTLIDLLLQRLDQPVILSDFSPTVLRRNRRKLEFSGLADRVTLLAFDARRTPFKQNSVKTMTTLLGLSNIEAPSELLHELRRIVSGSLLAIVHFFPEDDRANVAAMNATRSATFLLQRSALEQFAAAGWQAELKNVRQGCALPTPESVIFKGIRIDGLPIAETVLEWAVLEAR